VRGIVSSGSYMAPLVWVAVTMTRTLPD